MKKIISLALILTIVTMIFTGCSDPSKMVYNAFSDIDTENDWSSFEKFSGYNIKKTLEKHLSWLNEGLLGLSDEEISNVADIVAKDCARGFEMLNFTTVTDNNEIKEYEIEYGTLEFNSYGMMLLQAQLGMLSGESYIDSLNSLRSSYDWNRHMTQAEPLKVKVKNIYDDWTMACSDEIKNFILDALGYEFISSDYINDTFNNNAGDMFDFDDAADDISDALRQAFEKYRSSDGYGYDYYADSDYDYDDYGYDYSGSYHYPYYGYNSNNSSSGYDPWNSYETDSSPSNLDEYMNSYSGKTPSNSADSSVPNETDDYEYGSSDNDSEYSYDTEPYPGYVSPDDLSPYDQ